MDTTFSVSYYGFGMELAKNLSRIVEKYKKRTKYGFGCGFGKLYGFGMD